MTYKVILSGDGCEVFLHEIDQEKKKLLHESSVFVSDGDPDFEKIEEILEESWDYTEHTYEGVYPDRYYISIFNEDDVLVWESDEEFIESLEFNDNLIVVDKKDILLIEQYMSGDFREFTLEIDEPLDPTKFSVKGMEINQEIMFITSLQYDGKDISKNTWLTDKWTKDFYFHTF